MLALVQAIHKARKGQCALLKWRPQIEALGRGEMIYGREESGTREGFPTLPTTALALRPFLALGDVPGAVVWALFKIALAGWMLATVMRMAAGNVREYPPWALVAVIALTARVLLSDVAHGNVNIPIAALVVAAGRQWQLGHERAAGWCAGLAAVLKVTPALLVAYFLWKRGWRSAFHAVLAAVAFGVVLPALVLGPSYFGELALGWWQQMVEPYVAGAPLTIVQTEQINQSLLGVLARLFTDSTAIRARPPVFASDVSIHVASLSREQLRLLWDACALLVLAFVAWCARTPRSRRASDATLGELALVVLAMLFLSERSWKQHYVTLVVPIAYLAWRASGAGQLSIACAAESSQLPRLPAQAMESCQAPGLRTWSLVALALSTFLHGLTGSGLLGDRASDYAEACGAWFFGGLALFLACGLALRHDFKAARS